MANSEATAAQGTGVVIQGKLTPPPLGERLVDRPRVTALLARLIAGHPVVWVCATPGAGKTTAVVQAIDHIDQPVAWLTADATDGAPGRLLTYLEAAMARRVPAVAGVATSTLAARIPHPEAAGLLAEATAGTPLLLVVDGVERLADAPEALAVLGALVRHAPPTLRVAFLSRVEVPIDPPVGGPVGRVAAIGEADLAFTPPEAAEVLAHAGDTSIDPARAVEVTGGWVTGLLFEAWRSAEHVAGSGGEADPLHGYLASQILGRLEPAEREFLEQTSLLDEVTPRRAEALGQQRAGELLVSLRAKHLPVSWLPGGLAVRCHPRFREYLLERLQRRGEAELRRVKEAYGVLLMAEGLYEEATAHCLELGAPESALPPAERAIAGVIARLDFPVAERWLAELRDVAPPGNVPLTSAELMLAIGQEDYGRGVRVADRLAETGGREAVAGSSSMAASMMSWCYWHLARIDDAYAVIEVAQTSPEVDALRYLLTLVRHEPGDSEAYSPVLTGGPLDALIMRVHYAYGRLPNVSTAPESSWAAAVSAPWRIGALRAMGRLHEALELYEKLPAGHWSPAWLHGIVGAELMIDLGRIEEAQRELRDGRELIRASESAVFVMLNRLIAAKLELRLRRDPHAALAILDELEEGGHARRYEFIGEQLDTWRGLALLMSALDADAVPPLTRAVESMRSAGRILELPTAAVLLAEALWRADDEDDADRAADLALDAAHRQGSNHHLLLALADFPAVLARRLDAEPTADSPWHEIGRALMARGVSVPAQSSVAVRLVEFGRAFISVEGREVRPRIAKSLALLAYLAHAAGHEAERAELLDALFDGRIDDSSRAYLRQAVHQLREVLPGIGPAFEGSRLRFESGVRLTGESAEFELLLTQASRLQGQDRLAKLLEALEIVRRGEYLPGVETMWIGERRRELAELAAEASLEAAQLAFAAGRYREAERLAEAVLKRDPFKESAWRLLMRIANATGDEDRVIGTFRRCQDALGDVGATPSHSTQQLLEQLRR